MTIRWPALNASYTSPGQSPGADGLGIVKATFRVWILPAPPGSRRTKKSRAEAVAAIGDDGKSQIERLSEELKWLATRIEQLAERTPARSGKPAGREIVIRENARSSG
jgi:hypothetical protein